MAQAPKKKQGWFKEKYRIVVVNDNTFQESGSLPLSKRTVLIIVAAAVVLIGLLIFVGAKLFGSSPAGNKDGSPKEQMAFIYTQLDSLEKELEAKDLYIENMRKLVHGEVVKEEDVSKEELTKTENKPIRNIPFPEKNEATNEVVKTAKYETELGNLVTGGFSKDLNASQMQFICPLKGVVSDTFSAARKHFGTDIVAPRGSIIKAVQQGTVMMSQYTIEEGHTIGIQHSGNLISFYKHNSSLLKKMGDVVRAGEAIAVIGNSGERTNGPHLHFELWMNGKPTNAQKYIRF